MIISVKYVGEPEKRANLFPSPFPSPSVVRFTFIWGDIGSLWGLPIVTSRSLSEIGGRCLMGHQVITRSRRKDLFNSPYPELLQTPPSQILWDLPYSSWGPGNLEHRRGDLEACEHGVRYYFHLSHLPGASAIVETRLLERGEILGSRSCFPARVNLEPIGWASPEGRVASKTAKRSPNTGVHLRFPGGRSEWTPSNVPIYPKYHP